MSRIDSHIHVWRAADGETPGVTTLVPPQTDVPVDGARRVMSEHGVVRAVLVQPVFRGEDNSYITDCLRAEPQVFAGVCVVDPRRPDAAGRLEHWHACGCRGLRLRPRLADEQAIFGDGASYPLWEVAERRGIVVSVLCGPEHLPTIGSLATRFPSAAIVIDHLGHPDPAAGVSSPCFHALLALAACPRVFIKLSGFYHFSPAAFPFADCQLLLRAVCEAFGPRRLLWGSDFPHVTVTCGYRASIDVVEQAISRWAVADRAAVMGDNAATLYWPPAV